MAPKNKFTKEEMTEAALRVVRQQGLDGLTAKTMADALGTSTQPVFTAFGSMDGVRQAVYAAAIRVYDQYTHAGLREEPELYRLLFLTRVQGFRAMESMQYLQALVCPTLMRVYCMTAAEAERYFRDLWLVVHSLATLIVTGGCAYSDAEISGILTGFSVGICKAIKEIPGFASGAFDREAVFRALIGKAAENV